MTKKKTERTIEQDANKSMHKVPLLPSTVATAVNDNSKQVKNLKTAQAYAIQNEYVKAVMRVFGTSVSIATALYPLEVIQMRKQMGVKGIPLRQQTQLKGPRIKAGFFTPAMINYQAIKPLVQGFFTANKSSLIKNSVIANRETVSTNVDSVMGEKGKERSKNVSSYKVTLISSGIIASTDTVFTQYYANLRSLNSLGHTLTIPMSQRLAFFKQGLFLRGSRNYFSAIACMESTGLLSDLVHPYIPRDTNPILHNGLTSVVGGFAVAPFINAADVFYRRKIKDMDLKTYKTPSIKKVFTDLIMPQGKFSFRGVKALGAGTFIGGINGAVALAVLNGTSWAFDNYVFNGVLPEKIVNWTSKSYDYFNKPSDQHRASSENLEQPKITQGTSPSPRSSQSRNTFFASSAPTASETAKPQAQLKEEVEQTQSTGPRA